MRTDITLLKNARLFRELNTSDLERILRLSYLRKRDDGSFFFLEGDTAARLYLLTGGKVKLGQVTPGGQQVILRYVNPGETFGIMALLDEERYPVAAQAVGDCQSLAWNEDALNQMRKRWPQVCHNALYYMTRHAKSFQHRIRELSTERVERRIARSVLRLAQQTGRKIETGVLIDFPITRQDLAEMTGTTRYTVSRTLQKWEKQGLILAKREQIIIRYPHGLVSIAEDL